MGRDTNKAPDPSNEPVPVHDRSLHLAAGYEAGDRDAENEIAERYFSGLLRLVQTRISPALARRFEAEDIVQTVFKIIFSKPAGERKVITRSGSMWPLLVGIAIQRTNREVQRQSTEKRNYKLDQSLHVGDNNVPLPLADVLRDPTPDQAVAIAEELEAAFSRLSDVEQEIFQQHLQGESEQDIAEQVGRSGRTVRRAIEKVRKQLEEGLDLAGQIEASNDAFPQETPA